MKGTFWKEGSPVAMAHYLRPVYYYETDRMDCVHHSNYIRWFEEARIHLMRGAATSPTRSWRAWRHREPRAPPPRRTTSTMARFGETVDIAVHVESYTGTRIAFSGTRCGTGPPAPSGARGAPSHCFLGGDRPARSPSRKPPPPTTRRYAPALGATRTRRNRSEQERDRPDPAHGLEQLGLLRQRRHRGAAAWATPSTWPTT